jgi:signal transduction histidine kinase
MRRRLLTSYLALTVVVLIALEVPLALTYRSSERSRVATTLQRDAFIIGNYSEETLEGDAHAPIQSYVESYARRSGARAEVFDARGRTVADSAGGGRDQAIVERSDVATALRGATVSGSRPGSGRDGAVMFVTLPVATSGRVVGAVALTYPVDRIDDRVHRYWLVLVAGGLACLAAAAGVGMFLSRWVTRPLVPLRRAAVQLGHGDLSARVGVEEGPPEIRDLARTFDDMAGRLEELVSAQDVFVADASHQLRTPLTALRLRLENLEDEVSGSDAQDDLAGALRETQRMSRLVDGLLAIARADRGADDREREAIDLAHAIDERLDIWRPIAEERGLELQRLGSSDRISCSPDRLAQVIDNLLANAIDASPGRHRIEVRAQRSADDHRVELHVVDHGPGLDAAQRQHAFDRFWRAGAGDAATRAMPNGDGPSLGGSGLGLAIVRRLAAADGGVSELRETPGGGIDAVVGYPRWRG